MQSHHFEIPHALPLTPETLQSTDGGVSERPIEVVLKTAARQQCQGPGFESLSPSLGSLKAASQSARRPSVLRVAGYSTARARAYFCNIRDNENRLEVTDSARPARMFGR